MPDLVIEPGGQVILLYDDTSDRWRPVVGPLGPTGPQGLVGDTGDTGDGGTPGSSVVVMSTGQTITLGTSQAYVAPDARTISKIYLSCRTAGTGTLTVDILKNGVSLFPSAAKPTIAASTLVGADATPDTTTWAAGDSITFNVTQINGQVGRLYIYIVLT